MLPRRRKNGLLTEELPEEVVVYDTTNYRAHCLNAIARVVWRHCDGRTSEVKMVDVLRKELAVDAYEAVVRLTLEKLAKAGLLDTEERSWFTNPTTRRQAAKNMARFGIAAAAALVTTIVVPTPAMAATGPCANNQGCTTNNCCKTIPGSPGGVPGCGTCQPNGAHCPNGNC
jgi:hypothetical protein